jgi:prepilin-type N-terminal cleavage/methylation domain-containing protein
MRGFTLIELVIAVASVGILASIIIPHMNGCVNQTTSLSAEDTRTPDQQTIDKLKLESIGELNGCKVYRAKVGFTDSGSIYNYITTCPAPACPVTK